jgi:apolipoprotein N-acyltransferase
VFFIVENLRALTVFGFPWNLVGYCIASNDILLQLSSLWNVTACSAFIIAIASLIAKGTKENIFIALLLSVFWILFGIMRINYPYVEHKVNPVLEKTKIVQMDVIEHHKFSREKMRNQVYFYLEALRNAENEPGKDQPELVVFPEMAIPYSVEETPNLLNVFRDNMQEDSILVLGSPGYESTNIYNSLYYITKTDLVRYDKKLRVPFGEFIPFRDVLDKVKNFTNNYKDFSRGEKDNITTVNGSNFLSLICYEVIFPNFVKEQLQGRRDVTLLNITNDAWFYGTVAPFQHALIAKTRAVENGVSLIRAANAGYSYIIK